MRENRAKEPERAELLWATMQHREELTNTIAHWSTRMPSARARRRALARVDHILTAPRYEEDDDGRR